MPLGERFLKWWGSISFLRPNGNSDGAVCTHYDRKCDIIAPCCRQRFPCVHCHNNVPNQQCPELASAAVIEFQCRSCEKVQEAAKNCASCGTTFGSYHCGICKLVHNNNAQKPIYHCEGCGICRVGIESETRHCTKCGVCHQARYYEHHKCIEWCALCLDPINSPNDRTVALQTCGHCFHQKCLAALFKQGGAISTTCQLCQVPLDADPKRN